MNKYSRRAFLTKTGALLFGLTLSLKGNAQDNKTENSSNHDQDDQFSTFYNAFIQIDPNNDITFIVPNVEIGQGIHTAAAMLLAEELNVDLAKVTVKTLLSEPKEFIHNPILETLGSGSVAKDWFILRQAAASLRMMLLQAGALKFQVDVNHCRAEDGKIYGPDDKVLSYGELIQTIVTLPIPKEISLKKKENYQLIGKSYPRLDTDAKIKGKALYGMDIQIPNMKIGFMISSSVVGDKIIYYDDQMVREAKGILDVLKLENSLCIIAEHYWGASQAAKQLVVQWDSQNKSNLNTKTLYTQLEKTLGVNTKIIFYNNHVAITERLKQSPKQYKWFYQQPMLLHAALEPINCTVFWHDKQCELWLGSQAPSKVKELIAQYFHLDKKDIILHENTIGGSFGRRLSYNYILQAVQCAQHVTYPLKCLWSRETDFQCDALRPASVDQIEIGVDTQGILKAFCHKVAISINKNHKDRLVDPDYTLGLSTMPYKIDSYQLEYSEFDCSELNFGIGQGREATRNIFVLESMINRLAFHAQLDPIEYRKKLGLEDRACKIIDLLVQNAEWGKILPKGIRQGFAMAHVFGSYIAMVIEAEITATSVIRLHRVVTMVDCGTVVNPDQVAAQIESGIIFGLGEALYGEVQIQKGQIMQQNYNQYRILRMNEAPDIKVHLISSDAPPMGVGELGTLVAAPALAHALSLIKGRFFEKLPLAKQIFHTT